MTDKYKTLEEFANDFIGGFSFGDEIGDAQNQAMTGLNFEKGDFALTDHQQEIAEKLGQELIDFAKAEGVNLEELLDIKGVMAYDQNTQELSAKELGAYLVSESFHIHTADGKMGGFTKEEFSVISSELHVALGQQVFGDTNPDISSADTLKPESTPTLKEGIDFLEGKGRY